MGYGVKRIMKTVTLLKNFKGFFKQTIENVYNSVFKLSSSSIEY